MYTVAREIRFRAGHYLQLAGGKREAAHEHQWRVRATVEAGELNGQGMVMDFHVLGGLLREAVAPLTGVAMINDLAVFSEDNPSTERLARYIYDALWGSMPAGVELRKVVVWETKDCRASYRG